MSTAWSSVYDVFFRKIEKDADFFSYNNIEPDEAVEIAKLRVKGYLQEAVSRLTMNGTPDIDFTDYDADLEVFNVDLTNNEIDLLANIMREKYFEKDQSKLKAFQVRFSPKDLNVFSPANERKTFMDMFDVITKENDRLIAQYCSRDRITGKLKQINYAQYSSE
ncbi:hypothetical protein [Brevibacillus sp. NRS-1366]|uniref:hypothetical protein n=1 Tax=Brevibacillus sp. NRS-1366 TaxID=3233899 RepID=UPI003D23B414